MQKVFRTEGFIVRIVREVSVTNKTSCPIKKKQILIGVVFSCLLCVFCRARTFGRGTVRRGTVRRKKKMLISVRLG